MSVYSVHTCVCDYACGCISKMSVYWCAYVCIRVHLIMHVDIYLRRVCVRVRTCVRDYTYEYISVMCLYICAYDDTYVYVSVVRV